MNENDSDTCPPNCAGCAAARSAEKAADLAAEIFARHGALETAADAEAAIAFAATRLGREVTAEDLERVGRAVDWYTVTGGIPGPDAIPDTFVAFALLHLVTGSVVRDAGDEFVWHDVVAIQCALLGRTLGRSRS